MTYTGRDFDLFFELLQVALGYRAHVSKIPTDKEWLSIYQMAVRQAVIGLILSAVEKLNKEDSTIKPGLELFYQWLGTVTQIETKNRQLNEAVIKLSHIFKKDGLRTCVLKGQGLASLYPDPLRRQAGDIDLWVEGNRNNTLRFLKEKGYELGPVVIHHVDAKIYKGVETEIHFIPIWMYNPWHNHRLQQWMKEQQNRQFSNYDDSVGFCYPTAGFNVVYCLAHVYHHLLDEGVGLRQIVDYFYVVRKYNEEQKDEGVTTLLRKLGLRKFAGAMMWVLQEVCGMSSDLMICEPDERRGKELLKEIMATGNMGHYDSRYQKVAGESSLTRNLRKSNRWLELIKDYPAEVLCIPAWKLWHWMWRKWKGYR